VMHEGAAKVLDFGIAKLQGAQQSDVTRAGVIKGKLSYMPPEQLVGDISIDRRADVFAVGVMLWEAFARRRLWQGWDQQSMMKALVSGTMPPIREACSWISSDMEAVVTKAMAAKREQRYSTALELQMALEGCMGELGGAVQQREVASFMEGEFGEWRRDRQRSVDAEVRKPAVALDTVLEVSEIEEINIGTDPSLLHGHVSSNITASSAPRRSRLTVVLAFAVLAGLLFLGWRLVAHSDSARLAAPVSAPAPTQQATAPAPVSTPPPAQEAAVATEETPPRPVPSASGDAKRPRSARPAPPPRKVVAPAAPAPAASPPRNCTPPYVLDAEGVKTYKPECL